MFYPPTLSYWELKCWFSDVDFLVVGSGIVGLNAALHLKKNHPKSKVLVVEKGFLPSGASTKNAGFACFGSVSEILDDLQSHTPDEVVELVKKRFEGISLLRNNLGDKNICLENRGGYEFFEKHDVESFEKCLNSLNIINPMLKPVFGKNPFERVNQTFDFRSFLAEGFLNPFESQIDTGQMMLSLLRKVIKKGVLVLNGYEVTQLEEDAQNVKVSLNHQLEFNVKNAMVATNGFAAQLLNVDVQPARAQVLITHPIKNLKIKGVFHLDKGYYYFRNVGNRVLLGGGRNLDFEAEKTTAISLTQQIQKRLDELLQQAILPDTAYEVEHRWAGIMGIGKQKRPIVKKISDRTACAVRMGGMGVALGSATGKDLAGLF